MSTLNTVEQALVDGRRRGRVDEELLAVLRREPLVCGVDDVDGTRRPAAREVGGMVAVLAWSSAARAGRAGWTGGLVEQDGQRVAELLAGSRLGLVINAGDDVALGLDPDAVVRLAGGLRVPAGVTVFLGEPALPLEALETHLAAELATVEGVEAARIVLLVAGSEDPRVTVVLSLRHHDDATQQAAFAACDRAAAASSLAVLDVVVDDQLGGLRDAALAVPAAYTRGTGSPRPTS